MLRELVADFQPPVDWSGVHTAAWSLVESDSTLVDEPALLTVIRQCTQPIDTPDNYTLSRRAEDAIARLRRHLANGAHRGPDRFTSFNLFAGVAQTYREAGCGYYAAFSSHKPRYSDHWRRNLGYHADQLYYLGIDNGFMTRRLDLLSHIEEKLEQEQALHSLRHALESAAGKNRRLEDAIMDERQLLRLELEEVADRLFEVDCRQLVRRLMDAWPPGGGHDSESGSRARML